MRFTCYVAGEGLLLLGAVQHHHGSAGLLTHGQALVPGGWVRVDRETPAADPGEAGLTRGVPALSWGQRNKESCQYLMCVLQNYNC